MTARKIRAALCAFIVLSGSIVINAFFMQSSPEAITRAKAKAAREAARAELQRARRLSIDVVDRKRARQRLEKRGGSARKRKTDKVAVNPAKAIKRAVKLRKTTAGASSSAEGNQVALTGRAENVRAIQRELTARDYEPGLVDGVPGLVTRAAIMAYEYDHNMPLTGEPSEALLRRIILGASYTGSRGAAKLPLGVKPHAERVTRTVQQSLLAMGYQPGTADGVVGEDTSRAIREFEMDHGLVPTGRVSGHLVAQLARLAGRGRLASKSK